MFVCILTSGINCSETTSSFNIVEKHLGNLFPCDGDRKLCNGICTFICQQSLLAHMQGWPEGLCYLFKWKQLQNKYSVTQFGTA